MLQEKKIAIFYILEILKEYTEVKPAFEELYEWVKNDVLEIKKISTRRS